MRLAFYHILIIFKKSKIGTLVAFLSVLQKNAKDAKMSFRINTNVAALNAHSIGVQTNRSISNSLEKLSSGLRINKAADDASGMAIADSLRSQSESLG